MTIGMRRYTTCAAISGLFIMFSGTAFAGNSRSFFLGDEAAMTGGAGIAVSADSGSLWYNPAGLGGLELGRMELTGTVYSAKLRGLDNILTTRLPSGLHTASARADDFGSVPTSLVFVRHGNDKISYGAAWYQTRDAWLDFRSDLQARYDGSGAEWSEGFEYHQRAYVYHIGPSVGIQLSPRFRIGVSFYFVYSNFNASLRAFVGITDPEAETSNDTIVAVSEQVSAMDLGLMLATGIQWQVSDRWHVGAVIRTPTFRVWQSTNASVLDSTTNGIDAPLSSEFSYVTEDGSEMVFEQTVPLEAQLGIVYKNGRNWIGAEAAVRPPLSAQNMKTLWNASLGGRLALTPIFSWGAGIFTDNSGQNGRAGDLDWKSDRYGLTTGLEFRTPLIVKGKTPAEDETDDSAARPATKTPKERTLTWATTLALSYSFEIAEYNEINIDYDREPWLEVTYETGIFHQGFVYLGTALYF